MLQSIKSLVKKVFYNRTPQTLKDYGKKNGTDKVNPYHSFAGKTYLDVYNLYFRQYQNSKIKMLEIGIRDGASLRTFRDFFKKGEIIGLDINPATAFKENRVHTYIGSQISADIINKIFKEHPEISIVLDDGSHINELTIQSFKLIFDRLPKGSLYIIEDMECTYLEEKLASDIKEGGWPGMDLNEPTLELVNHRSDMDTFFQSLLKDLDYRKGNVEYIHFWSQICIIKKID